METQTDTKHIVQDASILGGKPHIAGHRIAVHHIAWWYSQGESAEALAQEYRLAPAEVHAALVYYYDHKDEIDREIAQEAAEHAALADADMSPIAQRMREAIAERKRQGRHVIDIVKDLPGHRIFKTAEEVDAYIRKERDAW